MPWKYEAAGTSEWTGTPPAPLIRQTSPRDDVVEVSFSGADYGFDMAQEHYIGRSLTLDQIEDLDILRVYAMNVQPLLPQHGAPLRIIVPGWYGMASVKWLTDIEALTKPCADIQQVEAYRIRTEEDDPGRPETSIRVNALMVRLEVPDWVSRKDI